MRIHTIDYMSGLMALSILFYHLTAWTIGTPPSETLLGKLGVYGVSVFFVISGMSMYISYKSTKWTTTSILSFFVRRFGRLAPVYWIALALTFCYAAYENRPLKFTNTEIWHNIFLTFGIADFSKYIVTGGWSIGNEVVFYLFFPALIVIAPFKKFFLLANAVIMYVYIYYCFVVISPYHTLGAQWVAYIHPFNQAFLFSSGIVLAWLTYTFGFSKNQKLMWALLLISCIAFILYPVRGDQITIISEWNRLCITGLILATCYALLNLRVNTQNSITKLLSFLGDVSYPVYLLHGIFFIIVNKYIWTLLNISSKEIGFAFFVFVFTPVLLALSWLVFVYIEKPAINIVKRLTFIERKQSVTFPSDIQ
ncbi:acyltransferase family protein [Citrobacter koseri]|uniref:acyltransferase family protein n=1 Tax=Citrobacter koseri TaxID=545 RepID=UPI0023AEC1C3|nr:acyltransferase [Citrobacter koseri]